MTELEMIRRSIERYPDDPRVYRDALAILYDEIQHGRKELHADNKEMRKDINAAIKDPSVFTKTLQSNTETNTLYGIDPAVAEAVTKDNNGMGFGFEYAKDNKEAVENFLKLFNIEGLDEEIYF